MEDHIASERDRQLATDDAYAIGNLKYDILAGDFDV